MKKKILLFKNDRGGDLLNSIQCISSLLNNLNDVTIFLSNYNILLAYFKIKINKAYLKNNLNFFDYNLTITLQITVKNGHEK